ncbi:MAG: hypothetical protein ACUZ8H_06190 [Candidatus Anammoxibacter sp.]
MSYIIENDAEFKRAIQDAGKKVSDLRRAWTDISRDWRKSNTAQFSLLGTGLYPPLSPEYKKRKAKLFPGKPILVATERLKKSVTSKGSPDHINVIVKSGFTFGTRVPYGIFHQSDAPRKTLPLRKFLFIGPEAPQFAKGRSAGRLERWLGILDAEVQRQLDKVNG